MARREILMSEHDVIRDLLALAAAGALDSAEQQRVEHHLAGCGSCAAELDLWRGLAGSLRRLPTPQAPAELVERTRTRVEAQLAAEAERRWDQAVMAFLVLFAWTVTLASWPIVRLFSSGVASWLDVGATQIWYGLVVYTLIAWLSGGVAAVMLGLRHRAARRAT